MLENILKGFAVVLAVLVIGGCGVLMYQQQQADADRCEQAGGFYEFEDGECEFPDGSEWGDGD